ncbi:MAG: PrpF domain-containing protein [Syntrophales bacterium]|nr:PrpF domain-containing protein [Syntrophales bacterium]
MKGKTRFSCTIMRGGTSKGVFLMEKDLPGNPDLRERIILAAFPVGRVGIRVSKTISDFLTGG